MATVRNPRERSRRVDLRVIRARARGALAIAAFSLLQNAVLGAVSRYLWR